MNIIAIAAVDNNWGIGKNGSLLFDLPEDRKFFRRKTLGSTVIMGANTWESLPAKPLKDRITIVVTHYSSEHSYAESTSADRVLFSPSPEEALRIGMRCTQDGNVWVTGGGSIYRALLPYCMEAVITHVDADGHADTFMPNLAKEKSWTETTSGPVQEGEYKTWISCWINQAERKLT